MSNLPWGAEYDTNAPWNQEDLPEEEIEVSVYVGLYKKVKLKVDDYEKVEEELDGKPYIRLDFSNCDLYRAASEQLDLDFGDWEVGDLDVFTV